MATVRPGGTGEGPCVADGTGGLTDAAADCCELKPAKEPAARNTHLITAVQRDTGVWVRRAASAIVWRRCHLHCYWLPDHLSCGRAAASSIARWRMWPDCLEAECAVAAPYLGIGKSGGLETARETVRVDKHHGVAEVSQTEQEARGAV